MYARFRWDVFPRMLGMAGYSAAGMACFVTHVNVLNGLAATDDLASDDPDPFAAAAGGAVGGCVHAIVSWPCALVGNLHDLSRERVRAAAAMLPRAIVLDTLGFRFAGDDGHHNPNPNPNRNLKTLTRTLTLALYS